jgi:hypothetical protein
VLQIDQDFEAARDHAVRPAAGDVHHEPDTAGVVFVRRIVKTYALRRVDVLRAHVAVIADPPPLPK